MADLIRMTNKKSPEVQRAQDVVLTAMMDGMDYLDVARKLGKGDVKKVKRWRNRIRRWMLEDPDFQQALGQLAKVEGQLAIPKTVQAVGRRASKGNIPAAKLLYESTGFHNPRVDHKHSGDISITIKNAPRPTRTEDEDSGDVVDAEVVE